MVGIGDEGGLGVWRVVWFDLVWWDHNVKRKDVASKKVPNIMVDQDVENTYKERSFHGK